MTKQQSAERQEAIDALRETLKPGDTVFCNLKRVSRSGMMRHISLHVAREGGIEDITGLVGRAIGETRDRDTGGLRVSGCGMDMGFHLVYNLGRVLFQDRFGCLGEGKSWGDRCPSNDHSNGDRDFTPHGHRGPRYDGTKASLNHLHSDGGYALRSRWL